MSFRNARLDDSSLLYDWRLRQEAQPWYESKPTEYDDHCRWIRRQIESADTHLLIWEEFDQARGTVRIDSNGEISFYSPDDAVALRMLAEAMKTFTHFYGGRLKAAVDVGDPRAELLQRAGFTVYPATFLAYKP